MPQPHTIDEPRAVIVATGQSNMSQQVQGRLLNIAASESPRLSSIETNWHGGFGLSSWVSGTSAPFSRAVLYNHNFANNEDTDLTTTPGGTWDGENSTATTAAAAAFAGEPWDLWLCWMQGETDAEDSADYDVYQARFEALLAFIRADLGCARVRWCAGLPERADATNATGLAAVRAALTAAAAADDYGAVVATDDLPRTGDNVHIDDDGSRETLARRLWDGIPKP